MATKIEIDWSKLEGLVSVDACLPACAQLLGCSEDTIERRIKESYNCTFAEYKSKHLKATVVKLKNKMISKALKGDNVCLIFALKNLSDWQDKPESKQEIKDIVVAIKEFTKE